MPKKTTIDGPTYVSLDTAAERWDVSTDTIRRLVKTGKVKGYRLNGRIIRVELTEIDAAFRPMPTAKAM